MRYFETRGENMMQRWLVRISIPAAVVAIAVTGCSSIFGKEINPTYCAAHPQEPACRDKYPDAAPEGCRTNDECSAPTAVCETASMMCVQCTTDQASSCTSTTPVCGTDNACRACAAHSECGSTACLDDGSCASESDVAYVDPAGTDNAACTKATPCTEVAKALATNRPYVKFRGTTDEAVTINDKNVTLLADPGAKLTRTNNGNILVVDGTSTLSIFDLEISGASGTGAGISIPSGGAQQVTLTRVKLANNIGGGISAAGGKLTVSRSTISGNSGGGILMSGTGVEFKIMNNFLFRNGNTITASAGGIAAVPAGTSKLEFNTIVDNQANAGAAGTGGVFCDQSGFVAANNIIFRNTGGTSGNVQTFGNCTFGNSFVNAGTSAVDNTPSFVHPNTQPFDYHLTASTPSTIRDAAGACAGADFDGDPRPFGSACDLGADEFHP